jgi:hypothetical protein
MILVWLVVTVAVAIVVLVIFSNLARVPDLAGRTEPSDLFDDPALVLEDPGILGSAVEVRVTRAVRECMDQAGFTYTGPATAGDLSGELDPARDGYGIAAGPEPEVRLGSGSIPESKRAEYEAALYGGDLSNDPGSGGCAAVGLAELNAAVADLEELPYSIEDLQNDVAADRDYRAARGEWQECIADVLAEEGISADSPDDLVTYFSDRLARSSADDARDLAEQERRVAAADFRCRRRHLDPVLARIAPEYGERFVEENRAELEALIPQPETAGAVDLPSGLGTGDVQITLLWDSPDDFDLSVRDPEGNHIWHGSPVAPNGGELDVDANRSCSQSAQAVENIYWPRGRAPDGTYTVTVTYLIDCDQKGPEDYRLVVQVDGRAVLDERSTIDPGDGQGFSFRYGS